MTLPRLGGMIAVLASIATPEILAGQTVVGRVLDDLTGAAVSTAAIMLLDSTDTQVAWAESDSEGRFFMTAPRTGVYRLYAERLAYGEILSETFSLGDAGSVEVPLQMVPLPVELDGLVVTTEWERVKLERAGFYRRRGRSIGYFIDEREIAERRPTLTTDLLRFVPGVLVRWSQRSRGSVPMSARRGGCPMKVVLDGFKLDTIDDPLDWFAHPEHVIGIEVYPGGVGAPIEHRGTDAPCGIVMIWTR